LEKVSLDDTNLAIASAEADDQLLALHDALDALARQDPRKAELVKHRYFAGLEFSEIAEIMNISERTAKRDWAYARAWLFNEMQSQRS
jgi:RNA polymerase sigma factor (sigma-70 family)